MKTLFIANWKMNMLCADAEKFCESFFQGFQPNGEGINADVGIAPPLSTVPALRESLRGKPGVMLGAQNVHWLESGAHTGEVSPSMLVEAGVQFVIVGHSERRQFYGETSKDVAKRAKAAIEAGMTAIVCVGESKVEFEAKRTEKVVIKQLRASLSGITVDDCHRLVVAYEPVWAIGTGLAATPEIAENVHSVIRQELVSLFGERVAGELSILYGGSTTPENIAQLMSQKNINGALVGGASLKPDVFRQLICNGRSAS